MTYVLVCLVGLVLGYLLRAWLSREPKRFERPSVASSKCGTTTRRVLADSTRTVLADSTRTRLT